MIPSSLLTIVSRTSCKDCKSSNPNSRRALAYSRASCRGILRETNHVSTERHGSSSWGIARGFVANIVWMMLASLYAVSSAGVGSCTSVGFNSYYMYRCFLLSIRYQNEQQDIDDQKLALVSWRKRNPTGMALHFSRPWLLKKKKVVAQI